MEKEKEIVEETFLKKKWNLVKGEDLKWRVFCAFFYTLLILGLKFVSSSPSF
jgi:hypothetical protein|tara:strand:+ start:581 stop:736 length:156 start_codon:yes stop_codon:yes gene_type:complete